MEWLHHLAMITDAIPNSLEWICPDGWTATVDLTDGVEGGG